MDLVRRIKTSFTKGLATIALPIAMVSCGSFKDYDSTISNPDFRNVNNIELTHFPRSSMYYPSFHRFDFRSGAFHHQFQFGFSSHDYFWDSDGDGIMNAYDPQPYRYGPFVDMNFNGYIDFADMQIRPYFRSHFHFYHHHNYSPYWYHQPYVWRPYHSPYTRSYNRTRRGTRINGITVPRRDQPRVIVPRSTPRTPRSVITPRSQEIEPRPRSVEPRPRTIRDEPRVNPRPRSVTPRSVEPKPKVYTSEPRSNQTISPRPRSTPPKVTPRRSSSQPKSTKVRTSRSSTSKSTPRTRSSTPRRR